MKNFEYFEVTADIGFRAYGKNLNEAFENAGLASPFDEDTIKGICKTADEYLSAYDLSDVK